MWNKQTREFDYITTKTYIGYFLFGVIPIYMILIKQDKSFGKEKWETFVNDYERLLIKSN